VLFFNEWRVASRAASAAERAVTLAYLAYCSGKGQPPTPEQVEESKRKRAMADDLFSVALRKWRESGDGPLHD
jgi:hypothetical protein